MRIAAGGCRPIIDGFLVLVLVSVAPTIVQAQARAEEPGDVRGQGRAGTPAAGGQAELNRQLLAAVRRADVSAVTTLLDAGADVEARDVRFNEGETPLHHAARTGRVELARLLVARGANVNTAAPSGFTPLHVASGLNRREMAKYLLDAGANPNAVDMRGTPLHAATAQGNTEIVELLLQRGADPNAQDRFQNTPLAQLAWVNSYYLAHSEIIRVLVRSGGELFLRDKEGDTVAARTIRKSEDAAIALIESAPLLQTDSAEAREFAVPLAGRGYLRALKLLRANGVALDGRSHRGRTPLHTVAAADSGRDVAEYLLAEGVSLEIVDDRGRTPLFYAVGRHETKMLAWWLRKGAKVDVQDRDGTTPLMHAAEEGHVETARTLLKHGASLAARDRLGANVMHYAVRAHARDAARFVRELLDLGLPVDSMDVNGLTPLHVTTAANAKVLLDAGADPNRRDTAGRPPLFKHIGWSDELVDALLLSGADPTIVAADGTTLLHYAAQRDADGIERALELLPDSINAKDARGRTPLHWAVERGIRLNVALLLKRGADVHAVTLEGNTALHLACVSEAGSWTIDTLTKAGADTQATNANGETPLDVATRTGTTKAVTILGQLMRR